MTQAPRAPEVEKQIMAMIEQVGMIQNRLAKLAAEMDSKRRKSELHENTIALAQVIEQLVDVTTIPAAATQPPTTPPRKQQTLSCG